MVIEFLSAEWLDPTLWGGGLDDELEALDASTSILPVRRVSPCSSAGAPELAVHEDVPIAPHDALRTDDMFTPTSTGPPHLDDLHDHQAHRERERERDAEQGAAARPRKRRPTAWNSSRPPKKHTAPRRRARRG